MQEPEIRSEDGMHEYLGEASPQHDNETLQKEPVLQQAHKAQMVLNRKPDNQALRYLFGICIIAVSIYVFYISGSMRNSPELFLIPVVMDPKGEACTMIATERFAACIPTGIDCLPRNGRLELYSAKKPDQGLHRDPGQAPAGEGMEDLTP